MGTCLSTSRRTGHVRFHDAKGPKGEPTEGTDSSTVPLSPTDSLNIRFLAPPACDPFESPLLNEDVVSNIVAVEQSPRSTPQRPFSPSSVASGSVASVASSVSSRATKALQSRLRKSRQVQEVISQQQVHDVGDVDQEEVPTPRRLLSASSSSAEPQMAQEVATHSHAWAEIPYGCTSVALSRTEPLMSTTPRLYLAVGDGEGNLEVRELRSGSGDDSSDDDEISEIQGGPGEEKKRRLGEPLRIPLPSGTANRIRSLDFDPSGRWLAVGGDDCLCTIFQLHYEQGALVKWTLLAELEREDRVYSVKFSPNGRYLAMGGFDGTVAVVATADLDTYGDIELVAELELQGLCFAVDWSPDMKYLAFGGSDKICYIVDVQKSWRIAHRVRQSSSIQSMSWFPTGSDYLAVASTSISVLDTSTMSEKADVALPKSAPQGFQRITALSWSPNGSYMVFSGTNDAANAKENKRCFLVETKTWSEVQAISTESPVNAICWGQQASLSTTPLRYMVIADTTKTSILKAGLETNRGSASVMDDHSSAADTFLSNRSSDWVFKENNFMDIDADDSLNASIGSENPFETKSNANVLAVAFSRGSKSRSSLFFAYATDDGQVTVLSVGSWRPLAELQFPKPVTNMVFSSGSRILAYGCQDNKVYVSETSPNWSLIATTPLTSPIQSLMFSKDNLLLTAGKFDGSLDVMNSEDRYQVSATFATDEDVAISSVDWSVSHLAVGRQDGSVRLFTIEDVRQGFFSPVAQMAKRSPVLAVAFGLSGRFLAVGLKDGHVSVYSAKGGWVLCHQLLCNSCVESLKWSPTGRFLAVGDNTGSIRVMDTVFWADVEDLNTFNTSTHDVQCPGLPLAYSQDGKLLAFARSHSGTTVVSSQNWKVEYRLTEQTPPTSSSSFDTDEALSEGI